MRVVWGALTMTGYLMLDSWYVYIYRVSYLFLQQYYAQTLNYNYMYIQLQSLQSRQSILCSDTMTAPGDC